MLWATAIAARLSPRRAFESPETLLEVAALLARGAEGGLDQSGHEMDVAPALSVAGALARALVVARRDPGPCCGVPCGGKDAHVDSELGDDCGSADAGDARDR